MTAAKKKSSRSAPVELPIATFDDARAWEAWLRANGESSPGVWLRLLKKRPNSSALTYAEALEVALCWGFIDGQKKSLDALSWLQKFSRRGPRSIWSKINRDKAIALIACGRMRAPGQAAIDSAKRDGRWDAAYDGQRNAEVPADLAEALAAQPKAAAFFAALDSANRYAVLFRVHNAKKAETRARRIEQFVAMLARKEKLHP